MSPTDDPHPNSKPSASPEGAVEDLGAPNNGSADDSVYDPSTIEVNRGREQGLGMGAADLARQRDRVAPDLEHLVAGDADED